jgi:hypothetical protein
VDQVGFEVLPLFSQYDKTNLAKEGIYTAFQANCAENF